MFALCKYTEITRWNASLGYNNAFILMGLGKRKIINIEYSKWKQVLSRIYNLYKGILVLKFCIFALWIQEIIIWAKSLQNTVD